MTIAAHIEAKSRAHLRTAALVAAILVASTACANAEGSAPPSDSSATAHSASSHGDVEQHVIYNYVEYSDRFASSGQPTEDQLKAQKTAGLERVIYVAFNDHENSLESEDRVAKELGLDYLQIPVDWKAPQKRDYYLIEQAMLLEPERKTLLHCQANFRASAFALLYRVLQNGVPLGQAKADMNSVWVPNSVWTNFILDVLGENNVETACSACDWTPSTIGE